MFGTPMGYVLWLTGEATVFGNWLNANQGIVSLAIFAATILFGWITGIFAALRRKPEFRIRLIPGPTFSCTFPTGQKHDAFDVHRTCIALYLDITNVGSASSSIASLSLGYHWQLTPFSLIWVINTLGWFWLKNQIAALADFQAYIGENLKVYPFLFQKSFISGDSSNTFLEVGQSTNGVVYFEQPDSWGGCFPKAHGARIRVKVKVTDAFGGSHSRRFFIPSVSLEDARKYNPSFGKTMAELRGAPLPFDSQNDTSVTSQAGSSLPP
jgi:hypothetical protein